jgi:3-hydroxyisobutyrate dehydrogenase-like beta-hydroxyacid dehydrogenase
MGSAMARNLIKAGHTVVVYNRTRSRAEELQTRGAKVAGTPGEAATAAEVLITMLGDDRALEDAMLGPGRALQSLPAGAVHVGMSTISVALSRRLVAAHWERRQYYVAAPLIESLAEAFSLVQKCGLDPNKFLDLLTGSLFGAPIFRTYGNMIAAKHFEPFLVLHP